MRIMSAYTTSNDRLHRRQAGASDGAGAGRRSRRGENAPDRTGHERLPVANRWATAFAAVAAPKATSKLGSARGIAMTLDLSRDMHVTNGLYALSVPSHLAGLSMIALMERSSRGVSGWGREA